MQYKTWTLANGLKVVHIKKLESPVVSLCLASTVGAFIEGSDEVGLAHFMEHMVLKKTEKYPDEKVFTDLIKSTGGISNGITGFFNVRYPVYHTTKYIHDAFDFLSQSFLHPIFDRETFDREKKVITEESKRAYSNIDTLLWNTAYSIVSPETRLTTLVLGTPEDIEKISLEKIVAFHKKWYVPENFILVVVSGKTDEEIITLTEQYFESKSVSNELVFSDKKVRQWIQPDTAQTKILHFPHLKAEKFDYEFAIEPITESEENDLSIIPDILQKRLHDILRTEHGLVYGVGSSSFGIDNFRIVSISFESAPENREKVKSIFTQVIASFLSDGITETQFERAQSRAQVQIEFLKEKSLDIAEKVALLSTKKNKLHTIENEEKNITSLTKESVERTLKKVLSVQPVEIIATSVQE